MKTQHEAKIRAERGEAARPPDPRTERTSTTQEADRLVVTHWSRMLYYDLTARPDASRPALGRNAEPGDAPPAQQRRARNRASSSRKRRPSNQPGIQSRFAPAAGLLGLSMTMYVTIAAALHALTVSHASASAIDHRALMPAGSRAAGTAPATGSGSSGTAGSYPAILVPHVDETGSTDLQDLQSPRRSNDVATD